MVGNERVNEGKSWNARMGSQWFIGTNDNYSNIKTSRVTLNSETHEQFVQCFFTNHFSQKRFSLVSPKLTFLLFVHAYHMHSTVFDQVIIFSVNFLVFLPSHLLDDISKRQFCLSKLTTSHFASKMGSVSLSKATSVLHSIVYLNFRHQPVTTWSAYFFWTDVYRLFVKNV